MSEQIVSVDEAAIKSELKELVKTTVEQTLNELLDEEADELVGPNAMSAAPSARLQVRALQKEACNHLRRDRVVGPQASWSDVPNRSHRALPQA